jgi:CDGSH-type Zn-finger protein
MRKKPYVVQESKGRKAYCACGHSRSLPHCDGSHRGTGISPLVVEIPEDRQVAICACGNSGNRPFCDGSHKSL